MIEGFDLHTAPLSDYEKQMAIVIANGLKNKVGKEMAVTSSHIIDKMKGAGWEISGSRLRKIINYIRINGMVRNLVSNSKGYYRTLKQKEVDKYVISLHQRAEAIRAVADSFKRPYKPEYQPEQKTLFNNG